MDEFAVSYEGPRQISIRAVEPVRPGPGQVRVRTLFSGISSGTELTAYRGTNPYLNRHWDEQRRLFIDGATTLSYPVIAWGYEQAGEIVEVASDVSQSHIGRRVFGIWGHRSDGVIAAAEVPWRTIPHAIDPRLGVLAQIGATALNGILDGGIHVGETVAVFGLGVVGQLVGQLARLNGATVYGIDPIAARRDLALALGVHQALDPATISPAEAIKAVTEGRGADVCVEASGSPAGLGEAIRTCAYSATVVAMGFYQGGAPELRLGEEFHLNRINIIGSQILGQPPALTYRWNMRRLLETFMRLATTGQVRTEPLITHVVDVADAPSLFQLIDEKPQEVMQGVLDFRRVPSYGEGRLTVPGEER